MPDNDFDDEATFDVDDDLLDEVRAGAARSSDHDLGSGDVGVVPTIDGYRELREIGRGGFSRVFEALQVEFDRWVAIKVLNQPIVDAGHIVAFERECRLMGNLSRHPNIVTVHTSAITSDRRPCIVMELFSHGSYQNILDHTGPLGLEELLSLSVKIAGALATAHQRGVIHGDVKPQNIFRSEFNTPAIGDFGIAALVDNVGESEKLRASVNYAAPELIEQGPSVSSPLADQYSLAATIYTLATGKRPYTSDATQSTRELLQRVLAESPPRLEAGFPEAFSNTLHKAMSRDPRQRHRDLVAFAAAVARTQQELGFQLSSIPVGAQQTRYVAATPQTTSSEESSASPDLDEGKTESTISLASKQQGQTAPQTSATDIDEDPTQEQQNSRFDDTETGPTSQKPRGRLPLWAKIVSTVVIITIIALVIITVFPASDSENNTDDPIQATGNQGSNDRDFQNINNQGSNGGDSQNTDNQSNGEGNSQNTNNDNVDPLQIASDDKTSISVSFEQPTYVVEEGDEIAITVALSQAIEQTISIPISIDNRGSTSPADYSIRPTSVTFSPGETHSSFTFIAFNDKANDDEESVLLGINNPPEGVYINSIKTTEVLIQDTDIPELLVSFVDSFHVVEEGERIEVTVTLSQDPERTVSIPIGLYQGLASSADYSGIPTSLTFTSGETQKSFTIIASNDEANEGQEDILLRIGTLPEGVSKGAIVEAIVEIEDTTKDKIAFVSNRYSSNWDIFVMNIDGTNVRRLTANIGNNFSPDVSPDGTQIAFTSDRDGDYEIFVMNIDTTNVRQLTNNIYSDEDPAWSPDGTKIAFTSNQYNSSRHEELIVMNSDGSNFQRLTNNFHKDRAPNWSPDGTQIAYITNPGGDWEIATMNADGSNIRQLTNNRHDDEAPDWSPDGNQIAFTTNRDGDFEIVLMYTDGSSVRRRTNNTVTDKDPVWSPDGTQIAFTSDRDGDFEILLINYDGSNVRWLTNSEGGDWVSSWS